MIFSHEVDQSREMRKPLESYIKAKRELEAANFSDLDHAKQKYTKVWGDLVEAIRQSVWKARLSIGDKNAWRAVYKFCFPPTQKLLRAKYGLNDAGEDIFQDALVVLYEYLTNPQKEVRKKVEDFVRGTAVKMRLNEIKHLPRRHMIEEYLLAEAIIIEKNTSEIEVVNLYDYCQKLYMRHFKELDKTDQIILNARYKDGCTCAEIGEMIGTSENTARQRVYQAKKRWRNRIKKDPGAILCNEY